MGGQKQQTLVRARMVLYQPTGWVYHCRLKQEIKMIQSQKNKQECCSKNCKQGRECPLRDNKELNKALDKTPADYLKKQGFKL